MNSNLFSELQLSEPIQRAVEAEGYTKPTPIQAEAIPHLLKGRDLLGCAQTGTGKTAAFALPILNRIDSDRRAAVAGAPQVLVLSPTRELAAQISESFQTYGRFVRFRQAVVFGGVNQNPQVRAMRRGVHILVATPGRLLDLMDQGHINLSQLKTFVLDEADRMLDMGFLPDLKRIISHLPPERHSLFFSATMAPEIATLAAGLLNNPARVDVSPSTLTVDRIEQRVMFVQQINKQKLLHQFLKETPTGRTLIFTRTKRGADRVAKNLGRGGFRADAIHGNKSQNFRTRVLHGFRSGKVEILVATDVAARGIDVDGITHVINFDLPNEPENYVHRIGRTGRAGADGIALSFCDPSERSTLRAIEKLIQSAISIETDQPFHTEKAAPRDVRAPRKRRGYSGNNQSGGSSRRPSRKRPAKAKSPTS